MSCLVTGGTGFTGSSLVEYLCHQGREVTVLTHRRPGPEWNLDVRRVAGDIERKDEMVAAMKTIKPQQIYHLAARTFVPDAFLHGTSFLQTNLMGTANILEAARQCVPEARILVVSSAGVYGAGGDGGRLLGEGDTMRPVDPYGASKAAAEVWARQEASRTGQEIVCVRPFGHLGSRQSHRFVAANLARQLQRIQEGSQDRRLKVGNLSAVREFNNVRDIAAGCVAALDRGRSEEVYNLCSGKGMSIQALADDMCRVAGIEAECGVEKDRLRPVDIQCLVGDPEKSREALGWQPVIPWEETLAEVLSVHDQPA